MTDAIDRPSDEKLSARLAAAPAIRFGERFSYFEGSAGIRRRRAPLLAHPG